MPSAEIWIRGGVSLLIGALHLGVGRFILQRRDLSPGAVTANRLFATWWIGLGILYLVSGPFTIAFGLGWRNLPFAIAYIDALLVLLCVALWGVLGFLVYVYTGTNRWLPWLAVFYGSLAFVLLWLVSWIEPTGFQEGTRMQFVYTRQLGGLSSILLGLFFSVPIFAVSVGYLTLAFRVRERAPRFRIATVGGAFAFQFGWSILSSLLGLARKFPDALWLEVVNQAIAVSVPALVIFAYRPPPWIRARLEEPVTASAR